MKKILTGFLLIVSIFLSISVNAQFGPTDPSPSKELTEEEKKLIAKEIRDMRLRLKLEMQRKKDRMRLFERLRRDEQRKIDIERDIRSGKEPFAGIDNRDRVAPPC